jgi:hypothetical protein
MTRRIEEKLPNIGEQQAEHDQGNGRKDIIYGFGVGKCRWCGPPSQFTEYPPQPRELKIEEISRQFVKNMLSLSISNGNSSKTGLK